MFDGAFHESYFQSAPYFTPADRRDRVAELRLRQLSLSSPAKRTTSCKLKKGTAAQAAVPFFVVVSKKFLVFLTIC